MNKKISLLTLSLIIVFFLAQAISTSAIFNKKTDDVFKSNSIEKNEDLSESNKDDAENLLKEINQENLPVGSAELHSVKNPEGVAVFIAQTHMNPGTKVEDPANDSAELTQKEIYEVIDHLNKEGKVDFIMLEGEEYGLADNEKIDKVSEKIKIREELIAAAKNLEEELRNEDVPDEKTAKLLADVKGTIKYLDREISLQGAPYIIKAKNDDVLVYGSENPDTYKESSTIVKNYIYQKDRLAVLEKTNGKQANTAPSSSDSLALLKKRLTELRSGTEQASEGSDSAARLENLKKLLNGISLDNTFSMSSLSALLGKGSGDPSKNPSFEASLNEIDEIGLEKDNEKICGIVQDIKEDCGRLDEIRTVKTEAGAEPVASRSENPYNNVNDEKQLTDEIKASEDKIQKVIIDKRNKETAENFKTALEETDNEIGILQFGAGHEEGLIAELNKQNLSVVIIKTDEVVRRETSVK